MRTRPCIDGDLTRGDALVLMGGDDGLMDATGVVPVLTRLIDPMRSQQPWKGISEALRFNPTDMVTTGLRLAFLDDDVDLMVASWLYALASSSDDFTAARVARDVREMRPSRLRLSAATAAIRETANDV